MTRPLKVQLRSLAKTGCAAGLDWTQLGSLVGSWHGLKGRPLVVGYHRVVSDFDRSASLSISPMLTSTHTFEQHLDWIGRRYRFVSLDELAAMLENQEINGKQVAAITFDDGYRDVYQNAFPILQRRGIPSAVFVVTSLIGTNRLQLHDELHLLLSAMIKQPCGSREDRWRDLIAGLELTDQQSERLTRRLIDAKIPFQATRAVLETLDQPSIDRLVVVLRGRVSLLEDELRDFQMLDWDMLAEMVAGGVTVGSHTRSHALLANETPQVLRDEVEGSRRELEQRLGVPIRHFAYPDGRFNARAIQAVADAGYRSAYTICAHQDRAHPLLTISRRMLWENACKDAFGRFSGAILSCQVNGIFDPADTCRTQHWG
jgi:peptidoglycan/xylan/chitin deacetylase (PgdA/CDA1 family)